MASACAPCVFGASSELISVANSVITVPVLTTSTVVTGLNGSQSTSFGTITLSGTPLPSGVQTVTNPADITTLTLGTTLTYGTTYVYYNGFFGAAQTTASQCAQSLNPSALTTPANANTASFVFPYSSSTGLPPQLLAYLDGNGFDAQLNGDQLGQCSILQAPTAGSPASTAASTTAVLGTSVSASSAVPASSSAQSSSLRVASTSSVPVVATATTNVPTTLTTSGTLITTAVQSISTSAYSYQPVVLLQPVSVRAVGVELSSILSSLSSSILAPQSAVLPSSSPSPSASASHSSTAGVGGLISYLASLTPGAPLTTITKSGTTTITTSGTTIVTVTRTTTTTTSGTSGAKTTTPGSPVIPVPVGTFTSSLTRNATNATATYSVVKYTGGASHTHGKVAGMGPIEWLVGLALPLLL